MIARFLLLIFVGVASVSLGQDMSSPDGSGLNFHSAFEREVISSGGSHTIDYFLATNPSVDGQQALARKATYRNNLSFYGSRQEKFKTEKQFLRYLFYRVQRKELRRYQQYVSLADQYSSGLYDCLTGTSLFYMYLTDLGYSVSLVETAFHIYLKVEGNNDLYLMESTDPLNGFVASGMSVKQKELEYTAADDTGSVAGISSRVKTTQGNGIVKSNLTERELIGLHYYNQAIAAWNSQNASAAVALIDKAYFFYPSARIAHLKGLFRGQDDLVASR